MLMEGRVFFYAWWLLVNGVQNYLALSFLLGTGKREKKRQIWGWISISLIMTLLALRFPVSGMFFVHILLLILYSRWILHMEWEEMAAPMAVLFTIATFAEGFSALALSLISTSIEVPGKGIVLQLLVSALSFLAYALLLRHIQGKYGQILHRPSLSGLYLLLLPCACMVAAVRFCLRLDSRSFEAYLSRLGIGAGVTAIFVIGAAALIFFLILESFCRLFSLWEEKQKALQLAEQRKGEGMYLEEARRQNQQYASFQHDIDNHLLVLSGLMTGGAYREAERYAQELSKRAFSLEHLKTSGNVSLDILLYEKSDCARERGINMFCDVEIPQGFPVEDPDLCALFSNILDNAITACEKEGGRKPFLSIKAKARGKILMIEGSNTFLGSRPVREGTGLGNVRRIAGRYGGMAEWEKRDGIFRISVLLCPFTKENQPSA